VKTSRCMLNRAMGCELSGTVCTNRAEASKCNIVHTRQQVTKSLYRGVRGRGTLFRRWARCDVSSRSRRGHGVVKRPVWKRTELVQRIGWRPAEGVRRRTCRPGERLPNAYPFSRAWLRLHLHPLHVHSPAAAMRPV
jgi:hypothetical protein